MLDSGGFSATDARMRAQAAKAASGSRDGRRMSSGSSMSGDLTADGSAGKREMVKGKTVAIVKDDPHWAHSPTHLSLYQDEQVYQDSHFGRRFVMLEGNSFRHAWVIMVAFLLIYTATIFIYRVCFEDFKIPEAIPTPPFWATFDDIVNWIFWADLVINFFFSYTDSSGEQVDNMNKIALHYLKGSFMINLIACIPPELVGQVIHGIVEGQDGDVRVQGGFRVARLQRVSRLARLMRLTRIVKLGNLGMSNDIWKKVAVMRGVRIVNYIFGLGFACHLLACGWYLCAAVHFDEKDTWVYRRLVGAEGDTPLADRGPYDHYIHAWYFVLTIFTTVGFGDMSANTTGEIFYVCFTMIVGAVIHSIIISEVINVVTTTDRKSAFIDEQKNLVESYAIHTEMDDGTVNEIKNYLGIHAGTWMTHRFNRDAMKGMIIGRYLPRKILDHLPFSLFNGQLMQNMFLNPGMVALNVPPRLPLILGLGLHKAYFKAGEVIYQKNDYAFNIFLVMEGTFAFVGRPSATGGIDDQPVSNEDEQVNASRRGSMEDRFDPNNFDQEDAVAEETPRRAGGVKQPVKRLNHLYPYRLFGARSYFGDAEMLWHRTRVCTARCESPAGVTLVLHKTEFKDLSDSFPQFASAWGLAANRREMLRRKRLGELTEGHCHLTIAAKILQVWWRKVRPKNNGAGGNTPGSEKAGKLNSLNGSRINSAAAGIRLSEYSKNYSKQTGDFMQAEPTVHHDRAGTRQSTAAVPPAVATELASLRASVELIAKEMRLMRTEMLAKADGSIPGQSLNL